MPTAEMISSTSKKRRQHQAIKVTSDFLKKSNIKTITTRQILDGEIPQHKYAKGAFAFVTDVVDLNAPLPLKCFDLLCAIYQDLKNCKNIQNYDKNKNVKEDQLSTITEEEDKSDVKEVEDEK